MRTALPQVSTAQPESRAVCDWLADGTKRVIERLLEAEVTDVLGRPSYDRRAGKADRDGRVYRNGYKTRNVKTPEGKYGIALPQLRNADGPYQSCLWKMLRGGCPAMHGLVLRLYDAGLSSEDIATFLDCIGDDANDPDDLLTANAIGQVVNDLQEDHTWFRTRDLARLRPVCLSIGSLAARNADGSQGRWCVVWSLGLDATTQVVDCFRSNDAAMTDASDGDVCKLGETFARLRSRNLPPPLRLGCGGCTRVRDVVEQNWQPADRRKFWRDELFDTKRAIPASIAPYVRNGAESLVI